MPEPTKTDVLIIGAGPIGLTTANALRHHGVNCRVLEEKPEPSKYSKANNVWARTQELLHGIGLRDALAECLWSGRDALPVEGGGVITLAALRAQAAPQARAAE